MDWIALASVVTSGVVGISGKATDAWSRRGDRKHESKLETDKRVWEAKDAALTALIDICMELSDKCEIRVKLQADAPAENSLRGRRIQAVCGLEHAYEQLIIRNVTGPAVAYSTNRLRRDLEWLIETAKAEMLAHRDELAEISRAMSGMRHVAERIEEARENEELGVLLRNSVDRHGVAADRIADVCELDVQGLKDGCESIIVEARKDLRGPN